MTFITSKSMITFCHVHSVALQLHVLIVTELNNLEVVINFDYQPFPFLCWGQAQIVVLRVLV